MQTPQTGHFIKDFGLFTSSLVLAEVKDGRTVKYKNLARVWELIRDEAAFRKYVHNETDGFLKTVKF